MGSDQSLNNSSSKLPTQGYHVLQVQSGSPGEQAGLVSYFDFIVSIEGTVLDKEDGRFVQILKNNIGKQLKLVIWNRKTELLRETFLTPSDSWGGSGLAGLSIRFCSFDQATENVWHVLDIYQNSPASVAGLQPRTDFIVGSPEVLLNDQEDFFTMIEMYEGKGKKLPLYIYSCNTDSIRLVNIIPNKNWGGNGSLGCDIGFGYLHKIPINAAAPSEKQLQELQQLQISYPPIQTPPGFAVQSQSLEQNVQIQRTASSINQDNSTHSTLIDTPSIQTTEIKSSNFPKKQSEIISDDNTTK